MISSINVFFCYTALILIFLCSNTVVSAGLFRIMGSEIAELPLVATSRDSQGLVSSSSYRMYYDSSFHWTIKNEYFEHMESELNKLHGSCICAIHSCSDTTYEEGLQTCCIVFITA